MRTHNTHRMKSQIIEPHLYRSTIGSYYYLLVLSSQPPNVIFLLIKYWMTADLFFSNFSPLIFSRYDSCSWDRRTLTTASLFSFFMLYPCVLFLDFSTQKTPRSKNTGNPGGIYFCLCYFIYLFYGEWAAIGMHKLKIWKMPFWWIRWIVMRVEW